MENFQEDVLRKVEGILNKNRTSISTRSTGLSRKSHRPPSGLCACLQIAIDIAKLTLRRKRENNDCWVYMDERITKH